MRRDRVGEKGNEEEAGKDAKKRFVERNKAKQNTGSSF
jgi:hypothetical protein